MAQPATKQLATALPAVAQPPTKQLTTALPAVAQPPTTQLEITQQAAVPTCTTASKCPLPSSSAAMGQSADSMQLTPSANNSSKHAAQAEDGANQGTEKRDSLEELSAAAGTQDSRRLMNCSSPHPAIVHNSSVQEDSKGVSKQQHVTVQISTPQHTAPCTSHQGNLSQGPGAQGPGLTFGLKIPSSYYTQVGEPSHACLVATDNSSRAAGNSTEVRKGIAHKKSGHQYHPTQAAPSAKRLEYGWLQTRKEILDALLMPGRLLETHPL